MVFDLIFYYCSQSFTWGGPNLDTFYIGTAAATYSMVTGEINPYGGGPEDGYLYKVTLGMGVKGKPERKIGMEYATCLIDSTKHKHKHGFKAKKKNIGAKVKKFSHKDH